MLGTQFSKRAVKGAISAEPFIDDNAQRVLVACRSWFALNLFRSHVGDGANDILSPVVTRTLGNERNAKIAEQNFVVASYQHILGFDIAVNQLFVVCIL